MPALASILALSVLALTANDAPRQSVDPVGRMLGADMRAAHEARPHGVPTAYDWAAKPRVGLAAPSRQFTAFTAWGQIYRCDGTAFNGSANVELRDLQGWVLDRRTGRWKLVQRASAMGGAAFGEDYKKATTAPVLVSRTARGTRIRMRRGYNFHFWPGAGRVAIDPRRTAGVAVLLRARVRGATGGACLLASVGGDYWRSRTAPSGSGNSADAGIGRFKRLGRSWRAFGMTTVSPSVLARHPLPARIARTELR